MNSRVSGPTGRLLSRVLIGLAVFAGGASAASAQTTVTVNQPLSGVVWATVRGGSHANDNDRSVLATRAATTSEYTRRALLKFDTHATIPAGSVVNSALLTVTVKTGSADASRLIGAYQTTTSWTETEVTWNRRRSATSWNTAGGDLGSKIDDAIVSNVPGTKVTFDVTPLVKAAVSGSLGSSRYTRIQLIDLEGATSGSYREYFMPDDANVAVRPVLKVTYGGTTSAPAPAPTPTPAPAPAPSTSGTILKVLHWNTHHNGIGSDGRLDTVRLMKWVAKFDADIISLGEVERYVGSYGNMDAPAVMANMLKLYTGKTYYYRFGTFSGYSNGIGNLILSRFPIDAADNQQLSHGRASLDATINVNGRTINFSSTHLHPESSSYRLIEIGELLKWQSSFAQQRIVSGDFNATATSTENATMKKTYYDSWAVAEANGTAVAYPGNTAGHTRGGRIDYIYHSHEASLLVVKGSQVFDTRDAYGVTPSDHRPLMTTFILK
jgi:endonuclease/exonuclease/phosphatase family metal-dependent hydrolase